MNYMRDLLGPVEARELEQRHDAPEPSDTDEHMIEGRRDKLIEQWLNNPEKFDNLRGYMDGADLSSSLQRMFQHSNAMRAAIIKTYGFDFPPGVEGFMVAWSQIERDFNKTAQVMWTEPAYAIAAQQFADGEL